MFESVEEQSRCGREPRARVASSARRTSGCSGGGLAARAVADEFDFEFERRRARAARGVLVVGGLAHGAAEEGVEPRQLVRRLRAQVNVHPASRGMTLTPEPPSMRPTLKVVRGRFGAG